MINQPSADLSPPEDLNGKRVLVTGGTKGIGAAIARRAADAGADVAVAARTPPDDDGTGRFIAADVSTAPGVVALAEEATRILGGVDVLINNAGNPTHPPAAAWETADDQWLDDLGMNLMSAIRLDRELLPGMLERGSGVIIHMSSVVSRFPAAGLLSYSVAKAALNSYSKGLSNEIATRGVRVNAVLPGLIETAGMTEHLRALAAEAGTDLESARLAWVDNFSVPMRAMGSADDVARLVVFLASPRADYLTGGQYHVDGGMAPSS